GRRIFRSHASGPTCTFLTIVSARSRLAERPTHGCRGDIMRVAPEILTVFSSRERREVQILMGGYRVELTVEEARLLASGVGAALRELGADQAAPAAIDHLDLIAKGQEQLGSWAEAAAGRGESSAALRTSQR